MKLIRRHQTIPPDVPLSSTVIPRLDRGILFEVGSANAIVGLDSGLRRNDVCSAIPENDRSLPVIHSRMGFVRVWENINFSPERLEAIKLRTSACAGQTDQSGAV